MQLKKIKLAGFKSFVDPTNVLISSNLVAVVGPNGCGKSNIIDAVCWVMGESSARYLRGESLTDVIFNGSSARKPIGQSSVELVFDNQDGSLGGEYASYAEISIRRQITRDAESGYFLNGTRCRRRDIIDIFLGTGLGPRSYSIIGQNMISRIVEAKPDEMRVYLEEAAGVSRYKERRRETETRIQHTQENMARLNDVRTELEKQLNALHRQANAAEKFKILKQEERLVRAQWYAIQWRALDSRLVSDSLQIQQQATGLEAHQADLGELNLQIEYHREAERQSSEALQEIQRRHYAAGVEIARLEQEIQHHEAWHRQRQSDLQQMESDESTLKEHLTASRVQFQKTQDEIARLEPESQTAEAALKTAASALEHAEEAMQDWQQQSEAFNQQAARTTQTAQVEQTRIQHLEQKITALQQQKAWLEQEQSQLNIFQLENELTALERQISHAAAQTGERDEQVASVRGDITALQAAQEKCTRELDKVRNELQQRRGQQASLETLQQTALGQRDNPILPWLAEHHLDELPRLAQDIEVEAGWEHAIEKVLGHYLQAICVDELSAVMPFLVQFKQGRLSVVARQSTAVAGDVKKHSLLHKVKSSWPLDALLAGVYTADSEQEALEMARSLASHESVITREGVWLGAAWLQVVKDNDYPEAGIFQRGQALKQLMQQINTLLATQEALEQETASDRDQLRALEARRETAQQAAEQAHRQAAEIQLQQKMRQTQLGEYQAKEDRLRREQEENQQQLEQAQAELTQARQAWQQALSELEQQAAQRESIGQKREALRQALLTTRDHMADRREEAHQLDIQLQTSRSEKAALQQELERLEQQLNTLMERKTALQHSLKEAQSVEVFQQELSALLNGRLAIEGDLTRARAAMETLQQEISAAEARKQSIEREAARYRDQLEALRVEWQGVKVKSETVLEQLKETGLQLDQVLKDLLEETEAEEWQARLEQLNQRIQRLGAINLVAIEEYAACDERKQYLDKQYADLEEGLTTLENAIARIDKETRARFEETFNKVNQRFQELFPAVFGGGKAWLELTNDNLLYTGITVMACPPGKRNSTIHLLSGGEKAMTAIALVFSIFHLNPAPFCMLDEVDAPLDDANIGRFCRLVKTMSEKTQFLFISHNKLAIEMAENLIGVTMHEPGVSRLVTVDVQEAMKLAGT